MANICGTAVLCIGGAVIDRSLETVAAPLLGTSNPVRSRISHGGVARNVAETLATLGGRVALASLVGDDRLGADLKAGAQAAGVEVEFLHIVAGARTAEYTAVFHGGKLFAAFADMEIFDSWPATSLDDLADIIGVNIGAGRDTADSEGDYAAGIATFNEVATYLTINISSPNTPGLRTLQARSRLEALIARVNDTRMRLARARPLLIKIAPDLYDSELEDIAVVALRGGVDGIIVSNTTLSRPPLRSRNASEAGGLSGRPLFELSTRKLARLFALTSGRLPLIGVGGIDSVDTAFEKLRAGAALLQLYSAMVYHGPAIARLLNRGLSLKLRRQGIGNVSLVTGSGVSDWL